MTKLITILAVLFVFSVQAEVFENSPLKQELYEEVTNHQSYSYKEARVLLFNHIYIDQDRDGYFVKGVYCLDKHYPFGGSNPGERLPNASVFNTEHTWPQSKFSNQFSKSTQKTDLHHLYPTFSRVNSERGNFPFAEVDNNDNDLFCDGVHKGRAESTNSGTYFEPPTEHKGNVARSMFYFSVRYKIAIDPVQEAYLRQWHKADPVNAEDLKRNELIYKYQKNRNPFIDRPELVEQISNF